MDAIYLRFNVFRFLYNIFSNIGHNLLLYKKQVFGSKNGRKKLFS